MRSKKSRWAAVAIHRAAERYAISRERINAEMALISFSNMLDYLRVGSEGDAYVDLSTLTREQAAAISEITVERYTEGRGANARDVRRVRFKLYDKQTALMNHAPPTGSCLQTKHLVSD
jgi:phage terminase small subunit